LTALARTLLLLFSVAQGAVAAEPPLSFELVLPPNPTARAVPLVVLLHGCDQTAAVFRKATGMDAVAAREGFAVLYPEQEASRNRLRCWNWYAAPGESADANEADRIVALVGEVRRRHPELASTTYVAGLSAGGAMAGYLATCYPNVFAGAAIHSSVSYLRARDAAEGLALMAKGPTRPVHESRRCTTFRRTPLLVLHGDRDAVVHPSNAEAVLADLGAPGPASAVTRIVGLGHAWSGGLAGMAYTEAAGVPSSAWIAAYFRGLLNRSDAALPARGLGDSSRR
jgi:poly(hydroxyalkanoate) depolymerase family esterase